MGGAVGGQHLPERSPNSREVVDTTPALQSRDDPLVVGESGNPSLPYIESVRHESRRPARRVHGLLLRMVGKTLGPYEILEPLGAGGMGEVYRARDTRLERDVAIKVSPAEFADDRERLARFEQEARAAAALNAGRRQ